MATGTWRVRSGLMALLWLAGCGAPAPADGPADAVFAPGAEGIDLSHHNGPVDWDRLDGAALDFVYLKATEGRDWKDPDFQDNWTEATARGWKAGAYHFYLLCKDGAAQAANFIQSAEVRDDALPPAVDLEYAHNCDPTRTHDETLDQISIFLDALETEYGHKPVLYTTPDFRAEWLGGRFAGYPVWLRSLSGPPEGGVLIWQYSMRGRVPGIEGDVDLNRVVGK